LRAVIHWINRKFPAAITDTRSGQSYADITLDGQRVRVYIDWYETSRSTEHVMRAATEYFTLNGSQVAIEETADQRWVVPDHGEPYEGYPVSLTAALAKARPAAPAVRS
jgi:hypothetical protein